MSIPYSIQHTDSGEAMEKDSTLLHINRRETLRGDHRSIQTSGCRDKVNMESDRHHSYLISQLICPETIPELDTLDTLLST